MEVERTYLLGDGVPDLGEGTEIRQGYLAIDGGVEVRVRSAGDTCTLTVKGGSGLRRTEVELPLGATRFDELWPLTEGRRVTKVRHLPGSASKGAARIVRSKGLDVLDRASFYVDDLKGPLSEG